MHHQLERTNEIIFLVHVILREKADRDDHPVRQSDAFARRAAQIHPGRAPLKYYIRRNKDVMVGTGGRVAIAAAGGQHARLPEHHCCEMWYGDSAARPSSAVD
jgi:hypothetical protein